MIYIRGNILDTNKPIIVHGCNALGVMGAGLALQIKQTYPRAFEFYKEQHRRGHLNIGEWHAVDCGKKCIINAITQELIGKYAEVKQKRMDAIEKCVRDIVQHYNVYNIAWPRIGCGLGGLNWQNDVEPIFQRYAPEATVYSL